MNKLERSILSLINHNNKRLILFLFVLNKLLGKFSKDLGIDLGTKNTLVYTKENGIVVNEASVLAINNKTDDIIAVGSEANKMIGKTPPHISAIRPLIKGVISNFEGTERMIKYFIDQVHQNDFTMSPRPRVIIGIPLDITEVEKKAVEDVTRSAGAREVHLVEEPLAAAIGARLSILDPKANLVVDVGGGTTEIAVISLGGVVAWKSLQLAGDELDSNIVQYIRDEFNILIGDQIAEQVKISIGSAMPLKDPLELKVRGRDLITGLPKQVHVNDSQIRKALSRSITKIAENIKTILETTPPELVSDIYEQGVVLTGGVANLRNFDKFLAQATNIPVRVTDDPLTCVVRGTGILLDDNELLSKIRVPSTDES